MGILKIVEKMKMIKLYRSSDNGEILIKTDENTVENFLYALMPALAELHYQQYGDNAYAHQQVEIAAVRIVNFINDNPGHDCVLISGIDDIENCRLIYESEHSSRSIIKLDD